MKYFVFVVISIFMITACKKEKHGVIVLEEPYIYKTAIVLTWLPADNAEINDYEVLRSYDGTHFKKLAHQICLSDDPSIEHSFADNTYTVNDNIYYQIIGYGEGTYISNIVCVKKSMLPILKFMPEAAYILPGQDKMLFFNANESGYNVFLYDFINKKYTDSLDVDCTSGFVQGVADFPSGNEFYYYSPNVPNKMAIYSTENLTKIGEFDFNTPYATIVSDHSNHLYYSHGSSIFTVDRANLSTTEYSGSQYLHKLYYMDGYNKLIGFSSDSITLYDLDGSGHLSGESSKGFSSADTYQYVPGTMYVYSLSDRFINMETMEEINSYSEDTLSNFLTTQNMLYAVSSWDFPYGGILNSYSLPDFYFLDNVNTNMNINFLLSNTDTLYLIGRDRNEVPIIERLNINN
jgi:hypothetical protein